MPQDCPSCSRPNGDSATRCLYCGATLEPHAAAPSADAGNDEPWPDTYTVLLVQRADTVDPRAFQSTTGRPSGILELGTPLPVGTFADLEEAKSLHRDMAAAGLAATVVADGKLGAPGEILTARRGGWTARGLELFAADGQRAPILLSDAAVLVRATISDPVAGEEGAKLRSRSVSGRVVERMAGGTARVTVLDIYTRSTRPARIIAERFDYSLLGGDRQPLAINNFETVVDMLRERAPQARYDTSFARLDRGEATSKISEGRRLDLHGRRLLLALLRAPA